MNRLLQISLAAVLLCSCTAIPKGVTPKPDVRPVQQTTEKLQASTSKTREYVAKERDSEHKVDASLTRASEALGRAAASKAVQEAQAALQEAEKQRVISAQYRDWADTELANSWKYLGDAKQQITVLSGQIDTSHQNETVAVAAVEKWKPIIDQVNSYWGLGAFAYGLKVLSKHLFIALIVLAVIGGALFIFARPAVTLVATWFTVVISWFRKK